MSDTASQIFIYFSGYNFSLGKETFRECKELVTESWVLNINKKVHKIQLNCLVYIGTCTYISIIKPHGLVVSDIMHLQIHL